MIPGQKQRKGTEIAKHLHSLVLGGANKQE